MAVEFDVKGRLAFIEATPEVEKQVRAAAGLKK